MSEKEQTILEAAEGYAYGGISDELKPLMKPLADEIIRNFIAGAEWQKEQMMKDAMEGEIVKDITNKLAVTAKNINLDGFKFGDKVKIIIVKED